MKACVSEPSEQTGNGDWQPAKSLLGGAPGGYMSPKGEKRSLEPLGEKRRAWIEKEFTPSNSGEL